MGGGSSKVKKRQVATPPKLDADGKEPLDIISDAPPAGAQAKPDKSKSKKPSTNKKKEGDGFSHKKLEELFLEYAADDSNMNANGVTQLCKDLDVALEDPVMLVFAWHLKAANCGSFTKAEWVDGFEAMKVDSLAKIKEKIPVWRAELESDSFSSIYEYAFDFLKGGDPRVLHIEMAMAMIELLLSKYAIIAEFLKFLKEQPKLRVMNRDQWNSLLDFCQCTDEDLSNYDEDGSWPVLMDEFVLYQRENNPDKYPPKLENSSESYGNY